MLEYTSDGDRLWAHVLEAQTDPIAGASPDTEEGAPTAVVLLHPTPLHHGFWTPVLPGLPDYRRIVPDLRGHGRSPLGQAPSRANGAAPVVTIAQLARDTIALLDVLEVKRAIFVGCSIGGYTLYELWRTSPSRIAALVFCASKPQSDDLGERARRAEWIAKLSASKESAVLGARAAFLDGMLAILLSEYTRTEQPALAGEVRAMMEQVSPESLRAIQRGLARRPDSRGTAQSITVPSCVIAGEHDSSSTLADMSALHAMLASGGAPTQWHQLARAGHFGPLEQPSTTAAILSRFCRSVSM